MLIGVSGCQIALRQDKYQDYDKSETFVKTSSDTSEFRAVRVICSVSKQIFIVMTFIVM